MNEGEQTVEVTSEGAAETIPAASPDLVDTSMAVGATAGDDLGQKAETGQLPAEGEPDVVPESAPNPNPDSDGAKAAAEDVLQDDRPEAELTPEELQARQKQVLERIAHHGRLPLTAHETEQRFVNYDEEMQQIQAHVSDKNIALKDLRVLLDWVRRNDDKPLAVALDKDGEFYDEVIAKLPEEVRQLIADPTEELHQAGLFDLEHGRFESMNESEARGELSREVRENLRVQALAKFTQLLADKALTEDTTFESFMKNADVGPEPGITWQQYIEDMVAAELKAKEPDIKRESQDKVRKLLGLPLLNADAAEPELSEETLASMADVEADDPDRAEKIKQTRDRLDALTKKRFGKSLMEFLAFLGESTAAGIGQIDVATFLGAVFGLGVHDYSRSGSWRGSGVESAGKEGLGNDQLHAIFKTEPAKILDFMKYYMAGDYSQGGVGGLGEKAALIDQLKTATPADRQKLYEQLFSVIFETTKNSLTDATKTTNRGQLEKAFCAAFYPGKKFTFDPQVFADRDGIFDQLRQTDSRRLKEILGNVLTKDAGTSKQPNVVEFPQSATTTAANPSQAQAAA